MRILVISDTHGDFHSMKRALDMQPNADVIIHCGDGAEQFKYLKETMRGKTVIGVRGNCDWSSTLPSAECVELAGKTVFITHGHLYNVKFGLTELEYAAREQKADIALFGHTHMPMTDFEDGVHFMNPGSCSGYFASFGIIDITEKGDVITNIVNLNGR